MNEFIEINEDNCVLEKWQLKNLDDVFTYICAQISPESKSYLNILFELFGNSEQLKFCPVLFIKINKLNDLAKEKQGKCTNQNENF